MKKKKSIDNKLYRAVLRCQSRDIYYRFISPKARELYKLKRKVFFRNSTSLFSRYQSMKKEYRLIFLAYNSILGNSFDDVESNVHFLNKISKQDLNKIDRYISMFNDVLLDEEGD